MWWMLALCPRLWTTWLADHSMFHSSIVCRTEWFATLEIQRAVLPSIQKYSDDSGIFGCISCGVETEHRTTVDYFVTWCERNHLQLNVIKSKELVVDLWRTKAPLTHVSIRGVSVNLLEDYTYLGVNMNNKLDWTKNSEAVYKKGQSRLYFLRRLKSFNITQEILFTCLLDSIIL